jgi:VWFA-related protein
MGNRAIASSPRGLRYRSLLATATVLAVISVTQDFRPAVAQQPTFSTGNRTVAVYATVTNAENRLVTDLVRDQFSIEDNGKKQELTLFANDIQPITVVILLDRSGSMRANFELVQKAAEAFVEAMLPADKARIGSFSNRIQLDPRDFTSSHDELLNILRTELQEEGPTPLWNAVNVGITSLLHVQGRRVVLVFTDGVDNPMNFSNNNSSLKDVMKRAEEEDVMVYAIGLAGQNGPQISNGGGFGRGGGGGRRRGGFGGGFPGRGGFGRGGYGGGRSFAVDDHPDEGLPKIAAATGGGYFELTDTSNLGATFTRVADELHHQYALGFSPTVLDGKMHALTVKVETAAMTVRARRSYLARKVYGAS